jgi:hypothetical protein
MEQMERTFRRIRYALYGRKRLTNYTAATARGVVNKTLQTMLIC